MEGNNMYNNLLLYRNELKIKSIPRYKVVGIVSELLYSDKIFVCNSEIKEFLKEVFSVEYKDVKSRTLLIAEMVKHIEETENISSFQKKLCKFVCDKIQALQDGKSEKNIFDGWI